MRGNFFLIILSALFLLSGCATHTEVDSIYEARQLDTKTNSIYLLSSSSYCVDVSTPVLNRYKEYFVSELQKEWSGVARYEPNCKLSDYVVFINIIHLDSNPSWQKKISNGYYRRVKLQIINNRKHIVSDYSIGEVKYLHANGYEYEKNRLFYSDFIAKYLNRKRVFGLS